MCKMLFDKGGARDCTDNMRLAIRRPCTSEHSSDKTCQYKLPQLSIETRKTYLVLQYRGQDELIEIDIWSSGYSVSGQFCVVISDSELDQQHKEY